MNVITHLLASWAFAEHTTIESRDSSLVTWAGVAPDLDGLGAIVDAGNRLLGRQTFFYGTYHHVLLHGLFGALLIPALLCVWARNRARVFALGFLAVHLHLLCDLVGSRGPGPADIWPIHYLGPFSQRLTMEWAHQWPLNAWPNIAITLALLIYVFARAVKHGHSPVELFSRAGNEAFVAAVRARWRTTRGRHPSDG